MDANFCKCVKKFEKVRISTWFEPVISRFRCGDSTNWSAMKLLTFGAGLVWGLMSLWRTNHRWNDIACMVHFKYIFEPPSSFLKESHIKRNEIERNSVCHYERLSARYTQLSAVSIYSWSNLLFSCNNHQKCSRYNILIKFSHPLTLELLSSFNPLTVEWVLRAFMDFTLANARRFYSPMGNPLDGKGLSNLVKTTWLKWSSQLSVPYK